MFGNLGFGEIAVLALLALVIFGPERLPKVAADAGRMLRQLRMMARGAAQDLRSELGPEMADLDFRDLHPRRFVQKHLFEDDVQTTPLPTAGRRVGVAALRPGERPPFDPDAT